MCNTNNYAYLHVIINAVVPWSHMKKMMQFVYLVSATSYKLFNSTNCRFVQPYNCCRVLCALVNSVIPGTFTAQVMLDDR